MEVSERVKLLLNKAAMSQRDFAKKLGISAPRLNNYLSGKHNIPQDLLIKMSELTNAELSWLLTGKGDMYNSTHARAKPPGSGTVSLPVYAEIAAGIGIEAEDLEPTETIIIPRDIIQDTPGPYYCFKVNGVSMEPELHTGDYAIISGWQYDQDYDGSLCAFRSVYGLLIKRLVYDARGKRCLLVPLNPTHKIMKYDENSSELQIIGRLIAVLRKYTY